MNGPQRAREGNGAGRRVRRSTWGAVPARVGRYDLVTRIGGGGMATVYLAIAQGSMGESTGFQRLAAVKVMHPHLAADRGFVDMFMDEARVAATIHHPHVVTILDLGQEDDLIYNVMEYIEGDTLAAVQATAAALGRGIPLGIVLRVVLDALLGLHAAHELCDANGEALHVVHRDVTPQNIIVGVDGNARLMDFGIARARGRLAQTTLGMLKGKLAYMAPEQLETAGDVDRRADLFSMGVTLWESLALRRLFPNRATFEMARRNARVPYRSLKEFHPTLPESLDAICQQALAHDPDERFATAAAFADAIEQALGGEVASHRETGTFMAAVARAKLEREQEAVRAVHQRQRATFERILANQNAVNTQGGPRKSDLVPAVDEPQRETLPDTRATAAPPSRRSGFVFRAPTLPAHGHPDYKGFRPADRRSSRPAPVAPSSRPAPPISSYPAELVELIDDFAPPPRAPLAPVRWKPLQPAPEPELSWAMVILACVGAGLLGGLVVALGMLFVRIR